MHQGLLDSLWGRALFPVRQLQDQHVENLFTLLDRSVGTRDLAAMSALSAALLTAQVGGWKRLSRFNCPKTA